MKIHKGDTIKVADIGTPGTVTKTGKDSVLAEFNFPEGNVEVALPVSIITGIIKRCCNTPA
jgi:hypothetical protein